MGFKARPGQRVLLLAATRAYQTEDFLAEAHAMGVAVTVGSDRCHVLAEQWTHGSLALDYRDPRRAAAQIARHAAGERIHGIVPTDDRTALIGALAASRLGLRANPVDAARAASNKLLLRRRLAAAGVRQPSYRAVALGTDPRALAAELDYPVVLKPLHLSASRGVARADDPEQFVARFGRLVRLIKRPEIAALDTMGAGQILVEGFVPGPEVALEGVLVRGRLRVLALFDKPEDLDGPYFPETIYTTPSELPAARQRAVADHVASAAAAMGLREGPVHAELRLGPDGPCIIEVAARSIGGLCARIVRYGTGLSLERIVIAHALGRTPTPAPFDSACGIAMLPAPARGIIRAIAGVEAARAVDHVREVTITARVGEKVAPLPDDSTYMGFAFAVAPDGGAVRSALRDAAAAIRFEIATPL